MKNSFLSLFICSLAISSLGQKITQPGRLKVSENGHYLIKADGSPFFWLGDTGWEMLLRLNREETNIYLEDRRQKGFNVIQTALIGEFIHTDKATNFYGDSILKNDNPEKPFIKPGNNPGNTVEYDFWDHVDYAVNLAAQKGLYLALVPSWGEWVTPRVDKALFNTTAQAYSYGNFLGKRYQQNTNIIWILGGDRHPDERSNGIELWQAMAEGIADGTNGKNSLDGNADYSTTMMTYHSFETSAKWFQKDAWLDLNMWGSYHAEINNTRAFEAALADWNLPNPKPTINGEPNYEGHGINYAIEDNGVFTSTDVRMAAYWSLFSGCAGFTYGAQPIWQFTDSNRTKFSKMTFSNWQTGLDLPGAFQMGFAKFLFESRPMLELAPDQSLIMKGQGSCGSYAAVIKGKSFAFIYIPTGNALTIKLGTIDGAKVKAWWFDPRTGQSNLIGEYDNKGEHEFKVPGMSKELSWLKSGRGCDWILVLDDSSKGFNAPGKK